MVDILGLGCVTVDDLLYAASFPTIDEKTPLVREERRVGGLTAVALLAAARLGARVGYAGMLGDDDMSRYVETSLAQQGVDVSHVVRRGDARPIHATIIVDMAGGTRTILYTVPGRTGADDELPPAAVIQGLRALLIDDFGMIGNLRAVRIARAASVPVVADFEREGSPEFDAVLALLDHPIFSAAVACRITGASDPAKACRALWSPARSAVVVTCGADGGWYTDNGLSVRHYPAFPVEAVDTTGCGDVFHGAYAVALAEGMGLAERVQFAAAAAALKATGSLPDREQVEAFLRTHGSG